MMMTRRGRGCWRPSFILFLWLITSAAAFGHSTDPPPPERTTLAADDATSLSSRHPLDSKNAVLIFYHVSNGKIVKTAYNFVDLVEASTVVLDGYVAGILVLCENEMDIYVGDVRMRKLMENADGTLSLDYFGRLNPQEFWDANMTDDDALYGSNRFGGQRTSCEKYALFPKTILDAVSTGNRFKIVFLKGDSSFELAVHHSGYRNLRHTNAPAGRTIRKTAFRYLGNRLDTIENDTDFDARVDAIAEGIALVERTFGLRLVHTVNLIDCESIANAITRVGRNDIWVYIDTFGKEPIAELKTIAIHETLHLLVDRFRFTEDYRIRKLFADLKGYDEFSVERFFLLTQGAVKGEADTCNRDHLLFAFINEKHFLDRKGGHSQDNLDEFCTSFVHSLMFLDRIDRNLKIPLATDADADQCYLTDDDRSDILNYYLKAIRIFHEILTGQKGGGRTTDFLEEKRAYLKALMHRRNFVKEVTLSSRAGDH